MATYLVILIQFQAAEDGKKPKLYNNDVNEILLEFCFGKTSNEMRPNLSKTVHLMSSVFA